MKILSVEAQNFASYKSLSFDYSNLGLALVTGATGSGKSTLVDIPCWILFGVTSKDGAADDVISWDAEGPTVGTVEVITDRSILVTRVRGKGKNDLYWTYGGGAEPIRGKDLVDSQEQLEALLGVTAQQYLLSSYFHQFSKMDSFFFAKAKERRELLESICDLEFPQTLGLAAQDARKEAKKAVDLADRRLNTVATRLESAEAKLREVEAKSANFESSKAAQKLEKRRLLADLQSKMFVENPVERSRDLQKQLIETQAGRRQAERDLAAATARDCPTCKRPFEHSEQSIKNLRQILDNYKVLLSDLAANSDQLDEQTVIYNKIKSVQSDLASISSDNPFAVYVKSVGTEVAALAAAKEEARLSFQDHEYGLFLLEKVQDLSTDLRSQLLQSTVKGLEKDTNRCLETHFDSVIRVSFSLEDSDKVEVTIRNDGSECSYKQLSGGQRRMLTLAFATSVMDRTANKAGFHPSLLVFDEALNGLDSELKVKAFTLFQSLAQKHESVLLMDHSEEMKELFDSKIVVTRVGSESQVEKV